MKLTLAFLIVAVTATAAGAKPTKPACSTARHCVKLCSAKNKAACARLDDWLEDTLQAITERRQATALKDERDLLDVAKPVVEAACNAKIQRACVSLGRIELFDGTGQGESRLTATCKAKVGEGCHALGRLLDQRLTKMKSQRVRDAAAKTVAETYDAGCKAKHLPSCYEHIIVSNSDDATALKALEQLCTSGHDRSCYIAGKLYEQGGNGIEKDATKATARLERGCKLGFVLACEVAAKAATDPSKRLAILREGCDAGTDAVCDDALREALAQKDAAAAQAIRHRLCELGTIHACKDLEREYSQIVNGRARDDKKAKAMRDQICAAGTGYDCVQTLQDKLPRDPDANTKPWTYPDPPRVAAVLAEAIARCNAGNSELCGTVVYAYAQGLIVKRDLGKARKVAARLCPAAKAPADPGADGDPCLVFRVIEEKDAFAKQVAACAAADEAACDKVASESWGPDAADGIAALEKGCKKGSQAACGLVAAAKLQDGDASQIPGVEAACSAGVERTCWVLFHATKASDPARALKVGHALCAKDEAIACNLIGKLHETTSPPDTAAALEAYTRACALDAQLDACKDRDRLANKAKPNAAKPSTTTTKPGTTAPATPTPTPTAPKQGATKPGATKPGTTKPGTTKPAQPGAGSDEDYMNFDMR